MQAFELSQLKEENISLIRIESSHTFPKKGAMGSGAKGGVMPTKRFTIRNDGEKEKGSLL